MLSQETENMVRSIAAKTDGPFYLYDLGAINARASSLRNQLGPNVNLYYSLKANSSAEILKRMKAEKLKADVASGGELQAALQAGFAANDISFTGPGKQKWELAQSISAGIGCHVVESLGELMTIEQVAKSIGATAGVSFRLTPSRRVNHVGRLQESQSTQFGFIRSEWPDLLKALLSLKHIRVIGTHSHVQSQILQAEFALRNVEFALEESEAFRSRYVEAIGKDIEFEQVCVGGGFGIPYSETAHPFPMKEFASQFQGVANTVRAAHPKTHLAFEFGRYLVGEAGIFVAKILYLKKDLGSPSGLFAIANGGFAQCQIACGAGQIVRTNLPNTILAADGGRRTSGSKTISIAGPTCYSQDVLARHLRIDHIAAGDLICVHNVGAYGKQFSPGDFLRQPPAIEFFEGR